jgi:hypothetical protein
MQMQNISKHQILEKRYNSARVNILLVTVITAVNIFLLVTNTNSYFLFSAYVPYGLIDFGMFYCGLYPQEYYGEEFAMMEFLDVSVFAVFASITAIILVLYLLSWIFSKKNRVGWMIFALAFFVVDTVIMFMFFGADLSNLVDMAFHAWVIISLVLGIVSSFKLRKLGEENLVPETEEGGETSIPSENSEILRIADPFVKSRTLLEGTALGHSVVYRRVKKVNELVIDGNVYDEYIAIVEYPHTLKATIGGHVIEAGTDTTNHSFITADGEVVARKLRLI